MPESVQSCFELSTHLSVYRTSRELLLKIVRGKKNTGKCMETFKTYDIAVQINNKIKN